MPNLPSLDVPHRLLNQLTQSCAIVNCQMACACRNPSMPTHGDGKAVERDRRLQAITTALVFGMWGSPEKARRLGCKVRTGLSEIVTVDVERVEGSTGLPWIQSVRTEMFCLSKTVTGAGGWHSKIKANRAKSNHGNIPFDSLNCGVRFRYTANQGSVTGRAAEAPISFK